MTRVVIVGAGLAGVRAAETLRSEGFVGQVTIFGDELHLPYDRPPLSKQLLARSWEPDRILLRRSDDYAATLHVDLMRATTVESLDLQERSIRTDRGTVPFDGLVIASGARARRLPGTDGRSDIHVVRTLDDCLSLRSRFASLGPQGRVAVIGAGFIGAEVAATAHGLGLRVEIVEAAPLPLERQLGAAMAAHCAGLHARHGVTLRTGVGVAEIGSGQLTLTDGAVIAADVVVVGVGVAPNTEWLAGSGVRLDDGVVCDSACRVTDAAGLPISGIVAAGDVARWPNRLFEAEETMRVEHWTNAAEMGAHAAQTLIADLAGEPGRAADFTPIPYFWSDQYETKIQFIGRTAGFDEVRVVAGSVEDAKFLALYRRGDRLIGALGLTMMRQLIGYRKLLAEKAGWADAIAHAERG